MTNNEDRQFEALLDYLKRNRGFDFAAYKRPSLVRRMKRRLETLGIATFSEYTDHLEVDPEEFDLLFNTILINVTSFFRDDEPWEAIYSEVIPRILSKKGPDDPIRVWCAGVASGQETYSIAMLLAEAMGEEEFQKRVKIYGTDADEEALAQARQAAYSSKEVESIPENLLKKYFDAVDSRWAFRKELRRVVIFGRHDLVTDAPISRVDLLVCRNTLMYFNAEAQSKILLHFHFALNDDGVLFLGKSEMLLTHSNIFTPLDLKRRIFTKVAVLNERDHLLVMAHNGGTEDSADHLADHVRLREAAFDTASSAQIVVDHNGFLVLANLQARGLFGITIKDLGRPFKDLEVSYKPIELRSRIEQAYAERRLLSLRGVEWRIVPEAVRFLDLQITPLIASTGTILGVAILFSDVTNVKQLENELQKSRAELETAYEEVQSTNEELETTNEELQSTNEELETLNEELQSTNEELETMNEELQSTNEELETVNEEMRDRTDELHQTNDFLESILTGVRVGVMVVDKSLRVQEWNRKSEDMWGLRQAEVEGQGFLGLDIGLAVNQLTQPVKACLAGEKDFQELILPARDRRGKPISCRVTCAPLMSKSNGIRGAILLMEEQVTEDSDRNVNRGDGEGG
jgi:two-component system, chemotaxis family, CheB/CheR fusion protein